MDMCISVYTDRKTLELILLQKHRFMKKEKKAYVIAVANHKGGYLNLFFIPTFLLFGYEINKLL